MIFIKFQINHQHSGLLCLNCSNSNLYIRIGLVTSFLLPLEWSFHCGGDTCFHPAMFWIHHFFFLCLLSLLLDKLARQRHSAAVEKPVSCRGVGHGSGPTGIWTYWCSTEYLGKCHSLFWQKIWSSKFLKTVLIQPKFREGVEHARSESFNVWDLLSMYLDKKKSHTW